MRYREPYVLYVRHNKHASVWYYYTYNDAGERVHRSTGIGYKSKADEKKTEREARGKLDELYHHGRLNGNVRGDTLDEWCERHRFWDWRHSTWVRGILARSEKDRPAITENYVTDGAGVYRDRIKPYHGSKLIDEITAADCEALLFAWADEQAHKTCNNYRSYYSTMLAEAARLGDIASNPWDKVQQLKAESEKRGGLTMAEGSRLLDADGLDLSNDATRLYYLATRVAFMAGLRIGEVCGLFTDDVRSRSVTSGDETLTMHYLDVSHQYHPKLRRRVRVKDKDTRAVPITPELVQMLEPHMRGKGRYLFSFAPDGSTPITANRLREWMYRRAARVGIDDREARNITFHSARRFFNTLLRRSVSGDVLRKMTGHDSDEMTEHYTDYLPEDLQAIAEAQSKLSGGNDE